MRPRDLETLADVLKRSRVEDAVRVLGLVEDWRERLERVR